MFHIDQISADLFSHDDAVADNGRGVCRFNRFVQCFPTCVVVFAHFDVRAEAAGSQNDAAVRGDRRRLITLGDLNTDNLAGFILNQFLLLFVFSMISTP